jgi:hypothetical protein
MRSFVLSSALVLTVLAFPCGQVSAQVNFSDTVCPEATQYVLAVGKLHSNDPPQRVYDAAQAAVNAYEQCSKVKLSYGYREAQHYADTRGAGLAVVAARALIALNRLPEARSLLQKWRPLVQQVVDWQAETETGNTSAVHVPGTRDTSKPPSDEALTVIIPGGPATRQSDKRPSAYRAAAKDVVAATDVELAKITQQLRDVSRPQAAASPTPAP